ncbi:thymidylate kinase [Echinococcus multilocularis]|uniref:dTMP kinase n=1 Tax=Echinococcus multilocularis TaxID=6211 RepID=A0A068YCS8_ECHMU|nr:thymidylate kinase [Echinococcus multilocularis]
MSVFDVEIVVDRSETLQKSVIPFLRLGIQLALALSNCSQVFPDCFACVCIWRCSEPATYIPPCLPCVGHLRYQGSNALLEVAFFHPQMVSKRGLFVVLEGLDRVGKSTQAKMLAEALSDIYGAKTYLLCFPDRSTAIGQCLSNYLSGKVDINPHAVHLLFTANRWEKASDIRTALAEGRCVVLDRYSYSGIVYTASKEHPDPPTWEWCLRSEEGLPQPDVVVCFVPSSVDSLEDRGDYGKERFENASFQTRVLANFRRLANDFEEKRRRGDTAPSWRWINVANSDILKVHKMVLQAVLEHTPDKV